MTDAIQRAAARQALVPLCNNATFSHKTALLRRTFGENIVLEIKKEEREAKEYNKAAKEQGGAILTPEAATYWDEVQKLIKRGMAAQEKGDQAAVDEVNKASESLAASFDSRVPDHDKPKFKKLDQQRHAETWDERWSYVEHVPPLLCDEFSSAFRIENVSNHAQQIVLLALAQPPSDDAIIINMVETGLALRKLASETRALDRVKELKQIFRKHATKETKKAAAKARKETREKMGMPKLRPKLKVVDGLFDVDRPERASPEPDMETGELKEGPRE